MYSASPLSLFMGEDSSSDISVVRINLIHKEPHFKPSTLTDKNNYRGFRPNTTFAYVQSNLGDQVRLQLPTTPHRISPNIKIAKGFTNIDHCH